MPLKVTEIYKIDISSHLKIPIYTTPVKAGFPSPAEDYVDKKIDLNEILIKHPTSTFFLRVSGNSMTDAGIMDGDTLIVDKSLEIKNDRVVIASINSEFTVKRIKIDGDSIYLKAENPDYEDIEITKEADFIVWGVVTYVIHELI